MARKIIKAIGWLAGALVGLVIVVYAAGVAVNWRDSETSATALRFAALYRERPAIADQRNAFVYLMGFEAPPGSGPQETGQKRIDWILGASDEHPLNWAEDPLLVEPDNTDRRPPRVRAFVDACGADTADCAAAFAATAQVFEEWTAWDSLPLNRYEELLARTEWKDLVAGRNAPLPPYASAVDAQRLFLLKASVLAEEHDIPGVNELLGKDIRFWRTVLRDSDLLISKMIAAAALTRHFEWGNLILKKLPPQLSPRALPAEWRTEIVDSERSIRRCLIGEWIYVSTTLQGPVYGAAPGRSLADRMSTLVVAPFFQRQATLNSYADYYARVGDVLDAPFAEYRAAVAEASALARRTAHEAFPPSSVYNFAGSLLQASGPFDFGPYAGRIADLEGVRRASLAAVSLREAQVEPGDVAAWLRAAALRDPYDASPFSWDGDDQAVVFRGLEPSERGEHRIYY